MTTVFDVANYILEKKGSVTTWKLQKLLYYSQAWSLVWDEKPLFEEEFEAWANGPVCRDLYHHHRRKFEVSHFPKGDVDVLSDDQKENIDIVLEVYGHKEPQWLSDLTHLEDPWKEARHGLHPGERGNSVITKESMALYYGGLLEEHTLPIEP